MLFTRFRRLQSHENSCYSGISNGEVVKYANDKKAIILTADKDFGELAFRQKQITGGVILIRLNSLPAIERAQIVSSVIDKHSNELLNNFTVITEKVLRIRRQFN